MFSASCDIGKSSYIYKTLQKEQYNDRVSRIAAKLTISVPYWMLKLPMAYSVFKIPLKGILDLH